MNKEIIHGNRVEQFHLQKREILEKLLPPDVEQPRPEQAKPQKDQLEKLLPPNVKEGEAK